jgi:photosystem II stability/assembly factor-like uncharacterized protein
MIIPSSMKNNYPTARNYWQASAPISISMVLFLVFLLSGNRVSAQATLPATSGMEKANFYQIQKSFNDDWNGRVVTRGSGYKPFKRWEWFWEQRVDRQGNFPPNNIVVTEWEKYAATHATDSPQDSAAYWTAMGPYATKSGYFGLGRINCIAYHPNDKNTFWAGTPSGGLWKTTDFGKTWTTNFDDQPVLGVSDMVIDPKDPQTMYIATGDGDAASAVGSINGSGPGDTKSIGVLKSINGGVTWSATGLSWGSDSNKLIRRLVMHPTKSNVLFAATTSGIYRTINGGIKWDLQKAGYFTDIVFKPQDSLVMYAARKLGMIFKSVDGGNVWDSLIEFKNGYRIILAVNPKNPLLLEAICTNGMNGLDGLYRSTDQGGKFTKFYPKDPIDSTRVTQNLLIIYADTNYHANPWEGQGNYDLCYLINPTDTNERWVGGVNTWKSTNSGKSWTLVNYWTDTVACPTVHADKHWFAFHPLQPGTFMEGNDGGIYYTKDGGNKWTDITRGMQIGQIYRIGGSYTDKNLVIAGFQDNGTQIQNDFNWLAPVLIGGDGMDCLIDHYNPAVQYASYCNGVIYRTTDPTWENYKMRRTISANIPGRPSGAWVTPYILHPKDTGTIYAGYPDIYKTMNGGIKWEKANKQNLPTPQPQNDTQIKSIEISPSNPKVMYAARLYALFKTDDDWQTYTEKKNPSGTDSCAITMIAVHPTNPDTLWVTLGGYKNNKKVYRSNDGGDNWINISGSLPNLPVSCIKYQNNSNDGLYIGTDAGVYYRNSGMTDWRRYSQGLPNVVVTDLEIQYMAGKIRASTYGRGMWESELYVEPGYYQINGVALPMNGGTITGAGVYGAGATVTMKVVPAKNMLFRGWYENDLQITDSSARTLTFAVNSNRNLVATFAQPVGVDELTNNPVRLYPNPSSGLVEVVVDPSISREIRSVVVTGIDGKIVYRSTAVHAGGGFTIDLSSCISGEYIVTLSLASGGKFSNRLVIRR